MPNFADIKQALRRQDPEELRDIIPGFVREGGSYDEVLQQLFFLSATEKYDTAAPLGTICIDAVRDLMTVYEDIGADPWPLISAALSAFCEMKLEDFNPEIVNLKPEDMSETAFVMDFEEYVRSGNREAALHESSKMLMLMDNPFYLVEILIGMIASAVGDDGNGIMLGGTILKQLDFVGSARFKPLIWQLTDYTSRLNIENSREYSQPESVPEFPFEGYYQTLLYSEDSVGRELALLTHAQQIWDEVRMKDREIRKLLADALPELLPPLSGPDESREYPAGKATFPDVVESLESGDLAGAKAHTLGYLRHEGNPTILFKALTEYLLKSGLHNSCEQLTRWNGFRTAIAVLRPPERYQAFLRALDFLLASGSKTR